MDELLSQICRRYVTDMSVSSGVRMRHVTRTNESCHTYKRVVSHILMSHVTDMNESCHTYDTSRHTYGMPHISLCGVTHMPESRHTFECWTGL